MDNPDGDPFADIDAEMNAVGDSPPDAEMPLIAPVAVPGPLPNLFNYGAAPVAPKVLLESKNGNLVATPKTNKVNACIDVGDFSSHALEFDRHESAAGLRYAQWFFIEFGRTDSVESVFSHLVELSCDVVGVCIVRPGMCCAVARRTKVKNVMRFNDHFDIKSFFLLKTKDVNNRDLGAFAVKILIAWLKVGSTYIVNFEIVHPLLMDSGVLLGQWRDLSLGACQRDILDATDKIKMKRHKTDRDEFVAKMGQDVLRMKKTMQNANCSSYVVNTDDHRIIDISAFIHTDTITCKTFDVITGGIVHFPLLDWWNHKFYRRYTLVLHGDSDVGKTQVALSLLSEVAAELQQGENYRNYFLKVGTIDSLRECADQALMKQNIPILSDEITPGKARGTRCGMSLEDVKHVCEIPETTSVDARNNDISFHSNQPRIFTSNAYGPHGWHNDLPADVFNMSNNTRVHLDAHVKAVFKRVVFASVDANVISQQMRDAHREALFGVSASSSSSNQ